MPRPEAKIDLAELEKLCGMQCTDEEIAAWFNVTTRTIERRRKVKKFAEVMERGKAKGRISVRRMQMKLLEQGNATMGVWLGKNVLGQVDEVRHDISGGLPMLTLVLPRRSSSGSAASAVTTPLLVEAAEADEVVDIAAADYEAEKV